MSVLNKSQLTQVSKEYNLYFLLVTFLIALQLVCNLIIGVQVSLFSSFILTSSALFYVLSFPISDVIAEVYGFEKAVRTTVYNILSQIVFCGIILIVVVFLEVKFSSKGGQSVKYFYDMLAREFFSSTLSLIAGKTANDFFIVYFGRKLMWRFFALRTILCTIVGEIVMLQVDYNITFYGVKSALEIQELIFNSMIFKSIAAVILAIPASMLAKWMKKKIILTRPSNDKSQERFIVSFFKGFKLW